MLAVGVILYTKHIIIIKLHHANCTLQNPTQVKQKCCEAWLQQESHKLFFLIKANELFDHRPLEYQEVWMKY